MHLAKMAMGLFLVACCTLSQAEQAPVTIDVAVRTVPPFAYKSDSNQWTGISVELWNAIAASVGWQTRWHEKTGVKDQIDALTSGEAEIAIGALSMTPEREVDIDFSHSFFTTSLAIAAPSQGGSWLSLIERFLSPAFLKAVGALALLLFAIGLVMWFIERRANPEQFGGTAINGLGNGFWWSAVTMTTVGYGDKAPVTALGRFVATVWMFISVITISGFTAAIASSVALEQARTQVQSVQDLGRVRTSVVEGSTGERVLTLLGVPGKSVPSLDKGLEDLLAGRSEALVYDKALLQFFLKEEDSDISLIAIPGTAQNYAIGMQSDFEYSESLNRQLLTITQSDPWRAILQSYLGN